MSSKLLSSIKKVHGEYVEEEFAMFIRGEICLITDFKGRGICYLFRYGSQFAVCDGSGYFQEDAFSDRETVKYFLGTIPDHRIKVNLEEVVNDKIYGLKFENRPYTYYSSKHK